MAARHRMRASWTNLALRQALGWRAVDVAVEARLEPVLPRARRLPDALRP